MKPDTTPRLTKYLCKSGRYKGKWHVRFYQNRVYFHIGRYGTEKEADEVIKQKEIIKEPR